MSVYRSPPVCSGRLPNRDIHRYVNRGSFREDLFHRLNTFQIHIPPLRELKNVLERAIITCEEDKLRLKHFSEYSLHSSLGGLAHKEEDSILDLGLLEKSTIIKALKLSGNNKTQAAALLNITWQALERRLKKYGID